MGDRWWLDFVPMWFRSRWPMKDWYWQTDELDALTEENSE